MISINEIRGGMTLKIDHDLYNVVEFDHVKPGKGSAFVRTRLKNIKTGKVVERTFRTSDKLEDVFIETRKLQYLYSAGDEYHFMDQTTYEQLSYHSEVVGDGAKYLKENMEVFIASYNHVPLSVSIPLFVELKVAKAEQWLKGDTAKGGTKPVTLETGAVVQVPLFVNEGDVIKIDTRTDEYVERVSTK